MTPITPALLHALVQRGDPALCAALAPELAAQLPPAGIDSVLRQAHFLAQAAVETWDFSRLVENLHYTAPRIAAVWPRLAVRAGALEGHPEALANAAYAHRNGNGDEASGDGWRFRGRGCFNLTGRSNYAWIGNLIRPAPAIDGASLAANPDQVAEPAMAVKTAVTYWAARGLFAAADADDVARVTLLVNGGTNGLAERIALTHRARALLAA